MIGPTPIDKITSMRGDLARVWRVWFGAVESFINIGEPPSADIPIVAANGISFDHPIMRIISSTVGNTTVTSNPQITQGSYDGQKGMLEGLDNVRTVTISDGNGLAFKGASPLVISNNDVIQFHWNTSKNLWIEDFRNT